jgi:hypothetical protein
MLDSAAARLIATGINSAAAYHPSPTRHWTIRRSNPSTPVLPLVIASTASAARKGPKPAMGEGARSYAYRIQGHHDRA